MRNAIAEENLQYREFNLMKRAITLLIFTAILLQTAACSSASPAGSDTTANPSETTPADTTAEALTPDLPDADYDGYVFRLFIRENSSADFFKDMCADEMNGDTMNDAIYTRNQKVAEQFNISFQYALSANASGDDCRSTILAGDDAYDLLVVHGRTAFTFANEAMLYDWNTDLTYVDLDKPWWNADARDGFTICDKLYAMTGDISYNGLATTKALYFNKAIFEKFNWDYPYQLILDGKWTFDKMAEFALGASQDLDGDSVFDFAKDQFGYASNANGAPVNIVYTAGQRLAGKNANNELVLTINTERTVDTYDKFFGFMANDGVYIQLEDGFTEITKSFMDGRVLFMETQLTSTESLRSMEDDFGIIPPPKIDASQENYHTGVGAGGNLFGVPVTNPDPERTSVILEALCYEGYKTVIPTYYDVVLSSKYARDEESVEMLEIIHAGRIYDVGYFSNMPSEISSIGANLVRNNAEFASYYAANEAKALQKIEEINAFYRGE